MNLFHSLGFFALGLVMLILPDVAPVLAGGAVHEARKLWLEFMGVTTFLIGSGSTAARVAAALPKSSGSPRAASATARARPASRPVFMPNA